MDNKALPLPDRRNYQYGYQFAYKLACEKLAGIKDLEHQCQKSGSQLKLTDGRKTIILKYLGKTYQISHPDIEVSLVDSEETVALRDKLLILHYLNRAKGSPITGRSITYKELPEGINYTSNFSKRTIKPLLNNLGHQLERLLDATAIFDAHRADYGDVSVTINAFSRVPITLVLWQGDDELAPEGSILFDSTIPDYLSTEDITVLCENIAWRLASFLKENG
ncbi:DUF3786 domain-containing protein [Chloroflexota bacterium]